jgi:glycosyltransferase involved in cell wall biosynthesis
MATAASHRPLVSVVIPTYNSERWLRACVESALIQTFRDIEVLVFDDASTDGTLALMAGFDDPRLRYVRSATNVRFAANVNKGLRAATGRYVIILGSDDILLPTFLERAVGMLEARPEAAMLHGGAIWIDDAGARFGRFSGRWDAVTPGREAFVRAFTEGFCFSTVVARLDPLMADGGIGEEWGAISDSWLFLRMCLEGDVLFLEPPLVEYRVRESGLSFELYGRGAMLSDHVAAAADAFDWPKARAAGLTEADRHRALAGIARDAVLTLHLTRLGGGYVGLWRSLRQVLRIAPGELLRPQALARLAFCLLPRKAIETARTRRRRAALGDARTAA